MKSITIAGGITRDSVVRTTPKGDKVAGFSVAVSEGFGQDKRTLYFDCSLWGVRAEKLAQYLTKGSKVAVSGDMSTREHDGKTHLTVRANEVTLLGGKADGGGQSSAGGGSSHGGGSPMDDGDDIPF